MHHNLKKKMFIQTEFFSKKNIPEKKNEEIIDIFIIIHTTIFFRNILHFFVSIRWFWSAILILFVGAGASDATAAQTASWIEFAVCSRFLNVLIMCIIDIWWNLILLNVYSKLIIIFSSKTRKNEPPPIQYI